jgi:hypothetical protein
MQEAVVRFENGFRAILQACRSFLSARATDPVIEFSSVIMRGGRWNILTKIIANNYQGKAFEKHLGSKTRQSADAIKEFNPEGWKLAENRQ